MYVLISEVDGFDMLIHFHDYYVLRIMSIAVAIAEASVYKMNSL